jgi:hypothetical protein
MHECPECGQACYCSGDLDDCQVFTEEWVYDNCQHPCEPVDIDDEDWDCGDFELE